MPAKTKTLELPDDVEALKALIAERDTGIAERDARIAAQSHTIDILTRIAFGRSSEKRRAQLPLDAVGQGHSKTPAAPSGCADPSDRRAAARAAPETATSPVRATLGRLDFLSAAG